MAGDRIGRLEELGKKVDNILPGPIYDFGKNIYHAYTKNALLNRIRRTRDYSLLWVTSRVNDPPAELHLGCGRDRTDMCDIDIIKTQATDYVLDARHLPFPNNSIERIESYHMVEHIPRDTLPIMLSEWQRVLESGGELIIELPDFDNVVEEYLVTDDPEYTETLLRYVFGSQRFESDHHYWGWNVDRLEDLLEAHGFEDVNRKPAEDGHAEEAPCMRVEAKSQ